jgi:catechol 2,3-dioxygenase-like lactoylglutathione lyase family enzyme
MFWKNAIPVLPSLSLSRTILFYENKLGFRAVYQQGDNFAVLQKDEVTLHFWLCDMPSVVENSGCYIEVTGINALYNDLQAKNIIHPHGRLEQKPWGIKQFAILDEDGNLITFGERTLE